MSNLPPTLPVLAFPLLVEFVDAEPQAAASTPATTIAVTGLKCRTGLLSAFLFVRLVQTIRVPPKSAVTAYRVRSDPRPVIYRKATLTMEAWSTTGRGDFWIGSAPCPSSGGGRRLTERLLIGRIPNHD